MKTFYPTLPSRRIEFLDMVRAIAIIGVLFSNIAIFSGFVFTPFTQLNNLHLSSLNMWLNKLFVIFMFGKAYPMLMLLFGVGLYIISNKIKEKGFYFFFIKRMFILLLIGLLHLIIWAGDVVSVYALISFLTIFFLRLKPKYILLLAIMFLIINFGVDYFQIISTSVIKNSTPQQAILQINGIEPNYIINQVQNKGYSGLRYITDLQIGYLWTWERYFRVIPSTLMMFLLGAYLYSSGFITQKIHKLKYTILFFIIGAVAMYLSFYVWANFKVLSNLFISLFYISILKASLKYKFWNKLFKKLVPLGRMTLTVYLLQSIICILIFYGIGFGFFSKMPLYFVYATAIVILILLNEFCKFWLKNHKYGPVEYIWRKLSYKKI